MNDAGVGILDASAFGIGLLAEIPSGALADKFGRGRIARLGLILAGSALALQAVGGFMPIFFFQILTSIGYALTSGADEALFFSKLKFREDSKHWRRLMIRGGQAALVASLIATLLGGLLYGISPQAVFIVNGIALVVGAVMIWNIKDEKISRGRQKILASVKEYGSNIAEGFRAFASPKLRLYIPLIITIQGLFYTVGMGLLRIVLLDRFHFSPFAGSVVITICAVVSIVVLHFLHAKSETLREKKILTVLALSAASGLLLSVFNIGWFGFVVILIFYVGEHVMYPFLSEILNKNAPEKQRSTVLSVASFFKEMPYVVLAPIIGWLSSVGRLDIFLVVWAILITLAWAYYFVKKKRNTIVKIDAL